jgi:hypothetical protein
MQIFLYFFLVKISIRLVHFFLNLSNFLINQVAIEIFFFLRRYIHPIFRSLIFPIGFRKTHGSRTNLLFRFDFQKLALNILIPIFFQQFWRIHHELVFKIVKKVMWNTCGGSIKRWFRRFKNSVFIRLCTNRSLIQ